MQTSIESKPLALNSFLKVNILSAIIGFWMIIALFDRMSLAVVSVKWSNLASELYRSCTMSHRLNVYLIISDLIYIGQKKIRTVKWWDHDYTILNVLSTKNLVSTSAWRKSLLAGKTVLTNQRHSSSHKLVWCFNRQVSMFIVWLSITVNESAWEKCIPSHTLADNLNNYSKNGYSKWKSVNSR